MTRNSRHAVSAPVRYIRTIRSKAFSIMDWGRSIPGATESRHVHPAQSPNRQQQEASNDERRQHHRRDRVQLIGAANRRASIACISAIA